ARNRPLETVPCGSRSDGGRGGLGGCYLGVGTPTRAARAVVIPFVASRVIVVGALVVTRHVLSTLHTAPSTRVQASLLGWDAAWYRDIARAGYGAVPREGLRFFPLFPMLRRAVAWLPGVTAGAGVVIVANLA